jgi:hypothetical protein
LIKSGSVSTKPGSVLIKPNSVLEEIAQGFIQTAPGLTQTDRSSAQPGSISTNLISVLRKPILKMEWIKPVVNELKGKLNNRKAPLKKMTG